VLKGRTPPRLRLLLCLWPILAVACGAGPSSEPAAATTAPAAAAPAAAVSSFSEEPSAPRARAPLTILQINDVYSTVPIDGAGGLARVATLKRRLSAAGLSTLLVLSGDFLSPSVASSVFKGEQMVAALNAAGLDMATFGNHEFDFGADVLRQRMRESKWLWVASNLVDDTGKPLAGTVPYTVRTFGSLRVGFIGLISTTEQMGSARLRGIVPTDPFDATAKYLKVLDQEKVDAVVALTHLSIAEDEELVDRFPRIDVVIGGHEHYPITVTRNRTLISKAGSEARFVARIDLAKRGASLDRHFELIPIGPGLPDDPDAAKIIASYEVRLGPELDVAVAASTVDLDAEELRLRASETNIGNLVADAIRESVQADVGLVNGGAIRGDRIYPASPLTRRLLLAMHPFGNVVVKTEVSGKVLLAVLNHAVSALPATAGRFPQVSGLKFDIDIHDTPPDVASVLVNGQPLIADRTYTLALPDYLFTGGDGFAMFAGAKTLVSPAAGELVVGAVERYVSSRKRVAPQVEGRITIIR
jgi:2',3'-cyclic-nucleotide 2'-phosphodiesterase (5'-nucleotidase family)